MARNIILTGIPRSGTTLTCSLLNKVANTLALIEPLDMPAFNVCVNSSQRYAFLEQYFLQLREDIANSNAISLLDIAGDGTNTFQYNEQGARKTQIKGHNSQRITKALDENFTLLIKHPNIFTALLGELKIHWDCYALVRNPLSVLASWESLAHPLSSGHAPMAELHDSQLRQCLAQTSDKLTRQLMLINWYFTTYLRELTLEQILRYEDIVSSAGAALGAILPYAHFNEPLQSYNRRTVYNSAYMAQMAEMLIANKDGAWRHFYSEQDLLDLL